MQRQSKLELWIFCLFVLFALLLASCSHNPVVMTIGEEWRIGNAEYGEISYINGIAIVDVSRENASWEMEIDAETGIVYDAEGNTIKGVKKIRRTIGRQVSGYLVELARIDPELAREYLKGETTDDIEEAEK